MNDEYSIHYKSKKIANEIRDILYPLVIRRSRLDLEAIKEYRDDLLIGKVPIYKKGKLPDIDSLLDAAGDDLDEELREARIENFKEDFEELKKEVPHSYLLNIIERENLIEEGNESLILSEEIINQSLSLDGS